jgi:hypothetical protein
MYNEDKVSHHRIEHEGTEGEWKYCSIVSSTPAPEAGGWLMPKTFRFIAGKESR